MQQGGRERGTSQPQYGVPPPPPQPQQAGDTPPPPSTSAAAAALAIHMQQQVVEEASPISSRPPAATAAGSAATVMNLDEFMRISGGGVADEDIITEEDADRGVGIASGNRWPRQEALALLQIRSEMDAAFRDATLKGPLWEDVSRKLAELGYKRSAKKCKEKFENVHKYYKRTKEGRAGRQDGKSYRFFTQLEALHSTATGAAGASPSIINVSGGGGAPPPPRPVAAAGPTTTASGSLDVAPVSVGIPMPVSSTVRNIPPPAVPSSQPQPASNIGSMFPPDLGATVAPPVALASDAPVGISFSSNESSSSPSTEDDDDDDVDEFRGGSQPISAMVAAGTSRKRKRPSTSSSRDETQQMMEFFEGLMKQVMQKQEAMQQRFLEAMEKREQDRMIREEAWKRQEMARLSREHEIMAQERAVSVNRDAAIVAFLQKITGQTIQLPSTVPIPVASQPPPPPTQPAVQIAPLVIVSTQPQPPQPQPQPMPQSQVPPQQSKQQPPRQSQPQPQPQPQQQPQAQPQPQQQPRQRQQQQVQHQHQQPISSDIVMAVPEQQIPPQEIGSGGSEPASSRWPKPEVLALIKMRSGLESRYQEAGPKGPLWEEISSGMQRMGYKRSAKRCKEKWENINKYFKKVKESNKKRPEDAKTCPYFHELDALYRKKVLSGSGGGGSTSSTIGFDSQRQQEQQQQSLNLDPMPPPMQQAPQQKQAIESQSKNGASVDVQSSNAGLSGNLFGEGNGGAIKKPEDIVKELTKQQGTTQQHRQQQHQHQIQQQLMVYDYDKMEEGDSENMNEDEYDEEDDGEDDDEEEEEDESLQEERKMAYKIEFQRQNTGASNGGGNGASPFLAMVQ